MVETNRLRIEIHGAVQGVGFRPFVYRLATELGLSGWVINDSRGVFIEVEGEKPVLQVFLDQLPEDKPAISIINTLNAEWLEADGLGGFASGTVGGFRTRRYHALLLTALTLSPQATPG